jgi:predicted nucleotidyltransferase
MKSSATLIDLSLARRGASHFEIAELRALHTLQKLDKAGIGAWLTGSLARGKFAAFSDVDFLIEGNRSDWSRAVTIIEENMGDIPVDVISRVFVSDKEYKFFRNGALDASGLRARRSET